MDPKRLVAKKIRISDLLKGKYVKEEGWTPNYIITEYGNVSRANILATVIAKNEDGSFLIDDGSANINVRSFDEKIFNVDIGDLILIIGKPREWNNQKYILPELVRKIEDKRWSEVRKLELKNLKKTEQQETKISEPVEEEIISSPYQKMLDLIRKKDTGQGAEYQEILILSNLRDSEKILTTLLEEGEIFEIKPGRLKVLE